MTKLGKSRKGFTLVEMVLTMAIIIILASIIMLGIGTYLDSANVAADSLNEHNEYASSVATEVLGASFDDEAEDDG
ncbi:MAG: prepilin-type N-terminal cleavage/methylation domain-containing protein [Clostridiales bacterium]|nr:prepilin-type N-terminal cleavage/methylation domain-containing protein [Clostridiales bacterium]